MQGLSGTLSGVAAQVYGVAKELEKPEEERQPGLTQEALNEFAEGLTYTYNDYFEPVDKAMLVRVLKMAEALPADQRITGLEYIFTGSGMTPEQWVEKAYSTSKLKDIEFAKSLIGKPSSELVKT